MNELGQWGGIMRGKRGIKITGELKEGEMSWRKGFGLREGGMRGAE